MWQSGGCGGCMPVSLLYHRMNGLGAGNQCGLLLIYVLHRSRSGNRAAAARAIVR